MSVQDEIRSILGIPVVVSAALPIPPSDGEVARRLVRHGMADVLAWLGEPVGPRPGDQTHALLIGGSLHASVALVGRLTSRAERTTGVPDCAANGCVQPDGASCLATSCSAGPARPQRGLAEVPITYGACTACGAVEVALDRPTGTRDYSDIGESSTYPVGYGCEACG